MSAADAITRAVGAAIDDAAATTSNDDMASAFVEHLRAAGIELVAVGDVLGVKDAAEVLGCDRTTVGRWRAQGYMPVPLGEPAGVPVWTRASLEALRDEHSSTSDAAGRRPVGSAR